MNIEQLIADLRARINPQYYDQIGTESYERHQVVKALEYLREENERQRFDTLAMNQSLDLMREENERLRKDATFAALRDEVNGLTGSLDRAEKALKEAQDQPAVAWLIHEYQGTGDKRIQFNPHVPSIRDEVVCPIVTELYARPVPAPTVDVPEEWREVVNTMVEWWDDQHMTMAQGREICNKARALLQSAEVKS